MRRPIASPALALIAAITSGCGRSSDPPVPPASAAQEGLDNAAEILKGANKSIQSNGPGISVGVTQVGPRRFKTIMDVPVSTAVRDGGVVVSFGGRKLAVEFDAGRILLDDAEKAELPAETKEIEVRFVGGKLSVTADGSGVVSFP